MSAISCQYFWLFYYSIFVYLLFVVYFTAAVICWNKGERK